jgi:transposase InsO family protein
MPWREVTVTDQREEFVALALAAGSNVTELCRRFGIARSCGNKWLKRFLAEGREGLVERSRRPHGSPRHTAAAVEEAVLRIRAESNNAWGGRKIAQVMGDEGAAVVPSASTITDILRRHGKLEQRASEHPGRYQRFERERPNELWQMDYKGHFALLRGGRCHPLTVIDDHSRYALCTQACGNEKDQLTRDSLVAVFRRYGLPDAMLMDNGAPWGDSGGGRFTSFSVWLMRLGIRVAHGRPLHPQTQGKDERLHRTMQAEIALDRLADLEESQRVFDQWRHVYNHRRPHQAIGMATPSERYRPSERGFPESLPAIEYGSGDTVRKADQEGDISFRGHRLRLGRPFRGEPIAVRPTSQDGVFSIHFCTHQIGTFDLREPDVLARGHVDIASAADAHGETSDAMPTGPQAQQQPQQALDNRP